MDVVVTAGNTIVPIDRVRCITNIFTGRTGGAIAVKAHGRGHRVTLLTSHPEALSAPPSDERWRLLPYRTFAELAEALERAVAKAPDVVIHCAAVNDYETAGIYAPAPGTRFDADQHQWHSTGEKLPTLVDRAAAKVKSDEAELWLRLVRSPKLIDRIRRDWKFRGILVKFKFEAGLSDEQVLQVAEGSRRQSDADLMVANTLEGYQSWAYLGPLNGSYERVSRRALPERLLEAVEVLRTEGRHD